MVADGSQERMAKELALLVLYLTSWEEEPFPGAPRIRRAWKNHRFEILDALVEEGLVEMPRRAKWMRITDVGVAKARVLES